MKKLATATGLFKFLILPIILFIVLVNALSAAPLKNVPQIIKQPNGEIIKCFASGDEFYHWLHDKDGYTIVQEAKTGNYVYARKINNIIVPSEFIVGKVDPKLTDLQKDVRISKEEYLKRRNSILSNSPRPFRPLGPKKGIMNNLVFFIQFADDSDFVQNSDFYNERMNDQSVGSTSMYSYYNEASYGQMKVNSVFCPTPIGGKISPYKDPNPRAYFQKYNATTNPAGYQNENEMSERKNKLCMDAIKSSLSQVPNDLDLDADNDGKVDAICFIVKGSEDGWGDLLWPTQSNLDPGDTKIKGKTPDVFSFQFEFTGVEVFCHETFHVMGAEDLYHYQNQGKISPVGQWDLMESSNSPAQHMCAFMKFKVTNWIAQIPEITQSGTYTLNSIKSPTNNCYKIKSPKTQDEYFVVEYRQKVATGFESAIPGSGLIVYRINTKANGNANGPPDEVYVYRPDGKATSNGADESANGRIDEAFFNSEVGRTAINDNTNPSSYLTDGTPGGLDISQIGTAGNTISFHVTIEASSTFKITGYIKDNSGNPISGVTVGLTGDKTATYQTGADGSYKFENLEAGKSYVVTPVKTDYTFNPVLKSFIALNSDQTQDFIGTKNVTVTYKITGTIKDNSGNPISGTIVSISGGKTDTYQTGNDGTYKFENLEGNKSYIIAPVKEGYSFNPVSKTIASLSGDQIVDFVGTPLLPDNLLNQPESITFDPAGNRYFVTNSTIGEIIQIDKDNKQTSFFKGLGSCRGILLLNNILYVTSDLGVVGININTGANVFQVSNSDMRFLNDIAADSSGNLYVTDTEVDKIFKIKISDKTISVLVNSGIASPNGIIFDSKNNRLILVSFIAKSPIQAVDVTTGAVTKLTDTELNQLDGIADDNQGNYYVSSWGTNSIYKFNPLFSNSPVKISEQHQSPADIFIVKPANILFVPNLGSNTISKIQLAADLTCSISGVVKNLAGQPMSGITMTLSGGKSATFLTGSDGSYAFLDLLTGLNYTVTPSKQYYIFDPISKAYTNLSSSQVQDFTVTAITGISDLNKLPNEVLLHNNYPNPFNPSTMIRFELPRSMQIKLQIYNSNGSLVRTILDGIQSAGIHEVSFDARGLSSGMYFAKLSTETVIRIISVNLIK